MLPSRLLPLLLPGVLLTSCIPVLTSPKGLEGPVSDWVAPENDWPMCEGPPAGLVGEGLEVGEVAPDFRLKDQFGAEVSLWQFHGCTVVLDFSTMWCAPCQELAEEAQAIANEYRDRDVVYVTVMPQDLGANGQTEPPDQEELQSWSESFELYEPILSDDAGYTYQLVTGSRGFPAVLIVGTDGKVHTDLSTITDEAIRGAIEDAL